MLAEWHLHLNHVAFFPFALHFIICGWSTVGGDGLAVEFDREALCCPIWHSELHGKLAFALGDGNLG